LKRSFLATLFLVSLSASFAQFGVVSSLNDVARHFGHVVTGGSLQSRVGLSGSVLGAGLAVLRLASLASLPLASLADRRGRVRVLGVVVLSGLLVTALAAASPSFWIFVLCFAVARPLLSSSSNVIQVLAVELSTATRRLQALTILVAGAGIGAGLSAIVHGLVRGSNSFRWLFALALIPALGLVYPIRALREPPATRPHESPRLGFVPAPMRSRLRALCAIIFNVAMITGPANGFLFVYSEGVLHITPRVVALVVALSALSGLAGLLVGRSVAHRVGRRATVVVGVAISAVTACFAYSGGRVLFFVGYVLGVGMAGFLSPALAALSTESFDRDHRATATGWLTVSGVLGATSGLFVFGAIGDAVNASGANAFRLAAIVTFLSCLWTLGLIGRVPERTGELDD
jgi:MFS family permease